jgi:hypothetical protein
VGNRSKLCGELCLKNGYGKILGHRERFTSMARNSEEISRGRASDYSLEIRC